MQLKECDVKHNPFKDEQAERVYIAGAVSLKCLEIMIAELKKKKLPHKM